MTEREWMNYRKHEEQVKHMVDLIFNRWKERPDHSLGLVIAQMSYVGAGHTDLGGVSDDELLKGLEHGWQPTQEVSKFPISRRY